MSAECHLDKRQLMRLAQAFEAEPAFITDLREPLPDLDPEQLVKLAQAFEAEPAFITDLREPLPDLEPEQLIKLAEDFYAGEEMKEKAFRSSIAAKAAAPASENLE